MKGGPVMGSRRTSRIHALQILYIADICGMTEQDAAAAIRQDQRSDDRVREFCETLTRGTLAHRDAIDMMIMKYAENWELKRMAAVDRNVLRLASFELVYQPETPVSVIIDEAVEIAKEYSTLDSGKFVNGILDKIKNERPGAAAVAAPTEDYEHKPR